MAQWKEIQSLAKSKMEVAMRLTNIYKNDRLCLLNIRQSCSDWIESIDWLSFDATNPAMLPVIQGHFQALLNTIDNVAKQPGIDIVKKINIGQSKTELQNTFGGDPMRFLQVIQNCLKDERLLIDSCENKANELRSEPVEDLAQENQQLMMELGNLSSLLLGAEHQLNECHNYQNTFRVEYSAETETVKQIEQRMLHTQPGPEQDALKKSIHERQTQLAHKINTISARRVMVAEQHKQLAEQTKAVAGKVWKEIDNWKKCCKLQITGLAKPKEGSVDVLEKLCHKMNQILMQLLAQLDKLVALTVELQFAAPGQPDKCKSYVDCAMLLTEQLLKCHLERVFVVDRNPQRVLKVITGKSLGFGMSVRILGGHALGLQMNPPRVTAELHKEQDIRGALQNHGKKGMCNVVNGKDKVMEFHRETKQWIALFNSAQLQHVKQLEKTNERLVMENLNAMVFYTMLNIRGKDYKLSAISLPMVLISHVLQDCQARAFIVWDAAFSDDDNKRAPFAHPEEVEWGRVAQVLNALFKENTGRGLTEDHCNYLGRIAFKERKAPDPVALNQRKISKSQLIKDKLQKDFQFWKWFYANMNLIKDRLKQEWQDGLIYGFIAKDETYRKLVNRPPGTFMLRFSESDIENSNKADICGCLTMAVIEKDPDKKTARVYHVKEHLTPKDIFERGLATTLQAFEVKDVDSREKRDLLTFLYPDKPFQQTFNKYILQKRKEVNEESDGYKAGQLRIEIFLADDPDASRRRKVSVGHGVPMSPASTMSVMSPAPSDISMPASPPAFPQSPPMSNSYPMVHSNMSAMSDASQQPFSPNPNGPRPTQVKVEGTSKLRAVGIVSPQSTITRNPTTAQTPNGSISVPVSDLSNMHIDNNGLAHAQQQQQQQHNARVTAAVSPQFTGGEHPQAVAAAAAATAASDATYENLPGANGMQPGEFINALQQDDVAMADAAAQYIADIDSGDIPINSGSNIGSGGSFADLPQGIAYDINLPPPPAHMLSDNADDIELPHAYYQEAIDGQAT